MASKSGNPAFEIVVSMLQKNPAVSYADVAAAAQAKGYKIYPIVYGRAKLLLGQVGVKPATRKKAIARKAARAATAPAAVGLVRRGPGRPRKVPVELSGLSGLDAVVAHMRGLERERDELRSVLAKLRGVLSTV